MAAVVATVVVEQPIANRDTDRVLVIRQLAVRLPHVDGA